MNLECVSASPQDTPYHRVTVSEMSTEQLEEWLGGVRQRRLKARQDYEIALAAREEVRLTRNKKTIDQHLKMLHKEMTSFENAAIKIEKRIGDMLKVRMIDQREDA
jgi:hypothetical protein